MADIDAAPSRSGLELETPGDGARGSTVARLFRTQAKRVHNLLRWRLKSEEDAQDASQDLFLRMWRREQEGALDGEAKSYLYSAAYNVAIDAERRRSARAADDQVSIDDVEVPSTDADAADGLFWRNALDHFVESLNELPKMTREVFALSYVDGLTHSAIAERLEMSTRNVERHLARAISHCGGRLKDYLE